MSSVGMLSLFLIGFIIFGLLLASLVGSNSTYNPQQVAQTEYHTYQVPYNTTYPQVNLVETNHTVMVDTFFANGTVSGSVPVVQTNYTSVITYYTVTNYTSITNSTTSYVDNCTGGSCSWWLGRLALLFAVIALSLFVLAFALATYGVATEESLFLRDGFAQGGNSAYISGNNQYGMGGNNMMYGSTTLQVVTAPWYAMGSVASAVLGLWFIFAAVLVAFDAGVGKHSHHWIAAVIILAVFGFIAGLALLWALFRTERAIAVQPVYAGVPVKEERVFVQNQTGSAAV